MDNNNNIAVFPNPAQDHIDINVNGKAGMITIYSIAGHIVRKAYVQEQDKQIRVSISDLATGSYTIVFESSTGNESAIQFIKK